MERVDFPDIGLTEATWRVDLSGLTNPYLRFSHSEYDTENGFGGSFTGHYNADGVAISEDGVTWHPVLTPTTQMRKWPAFTVDLGAEAAHAGSL